MTFDDRDIARATPCVSWITFGLRSVYSMKTQAQRICMACLHSSLEANRVKHCNEVVEVGQWTPTLSVVRLLVR